MAAKHGGARPGAGRKPGKVGEAKRMIAESAKEYGEAALATLAQVMRDGESESARISAAVALLDRGYGKPTQTADLNHSGDIPAAISLLAVAPDGE
jgi:type IV secretory pathway TrbL component